MKIYLFLSLVLLFTTTSAQPPQIEWQKCLGGTAQDAGRYCEKTADNGYLEVGGAYSNNGDVNGNQGGSDYWVIKLDSSGNVEWQKCYGGTGNDFAYGFTQTNDGGYAVVGMTYSSDGDVSGFHGFIDCWVIKLDEDGDLEWQKCLGGSSAEYVSTIRQTADGGFILYGATDSNDGDVNGNHGGLESWVVKLNSAGAIEWQKCLGGTGDEYGNAIEQTDDIGYILVGAASSNNGDVSGNHGNADCWIVKLDSAGTVEWQKCFGGTNDEHARAVKQLTAGYLISGWTSSNNGDVTGNHGNADVWILRLSVNGDLQWQRCFGGTQFDYAYCHQEIDGGCVFAGASNSNNGDVSGNHGNYDVWMGRVDSNGVFQWQKSMGGTAGDYAYSVHMTGVDEYIVNGQTYSNNGDVAGHHGDADHWLIKLSSSDTSSLTLSFAVNDTIGCETGLCIADVDLVALGTGPFAFVWSNGANTEDLSNVCSGIYNVTVTNSAGLSTIASVTVNVISDTIIAAAVTTDATCGSPNGAIDLTVSGGTAPYQFLWSNGATTEDIANLQQGIYHVSVIDGNGCNETLGVSLTAISTVEVTAVPVDANCGLANGMVNSNASFGTPPVVFSWSTGETGSTIDSLETGVYSVTATDADGCTSADTVFVSLSGPAATACFDNINSTCACTLPYTVSLSNCSSGSGSLLSTWIISPSTTSVIVSSDTSTITLDSFGHYDLALIVTDSLGCTDTVGTSDYIRILNQNVVATYDSPIVNVDQPVLFSAFNADGYHWYFTQPYNATIVDTSAQQTNIFFYEAGSYNLCVEGIFFDTCSACPNTLFCTTIIAVDDTVGIRKPDRSFIDVLVYPNPATNMIVLEFARRVARPLTLKLFDALGRMQASHLIQPNATSYQLDTSTLPRGMYSFVLETLDNRNVLRSKLALQ